MKTTSKKLILSLFLSPALSFSQVNPDSVTIVRDQWGVPHIYGKTDEEATYGLGWAYCEDDFKTLQLTLLPTKGLLSKVQGKSGATRDVIAHILGLDELVNEKYESELSPKFKKVLEAYTQALNDYANKHPEEILEKKLFPLTPKDVIKGYTLALSFMSFSHVDIANIVKNRVKLNEQLPGGSNGFAISKNKTDNHKTFFCSNSHQPIEGPFSWYEAHLVSEEGLNILGATFGGGLSIFVGSNENLGWTHCLNRPDVSDVYKLTMHPKQKNTYLFDGKWEQLNVRKIKLKVKMGIVHLPITKTYYWSKLGTTIKNKDGYYAVSLSATSSIKAAEQWYRMDKAKNYTEFRKALDLQGIPAINIVYADKSDTIFYLANAKFPYRRIRVGGIDALRGDTSSLAWTGKFYPVDSLPQQINPACGFVFNTNNTPYNTSCNKKDEPNHNFKSIYYEEGNNNRSNRFQHLMEKEDILSWEEFKKIKYDKSYQSPMQTYTINNIEDFFHINKTKHPEIADVIDILTNWNREADIESEGATIAVVAVHFMANYLSKNNLLLTRSTLDESVFVDALTKTKKHLIKYFGTVHVPLGKVQKLVRGEVEFPVNGAFDVLSAMKVDEYKDGKFKAVNGESYIQMVQFSKNGSEMIESINAFGSSNHPESKHYTDQMELYSKQKLKRMTLNRNEIFKNAVKIYHPK